MGLCLWVHVNNYASQPLCNDQLKYVVLFFTAPWLRGIWIAALVLSAVGLMIKFVIHAVLLLAVRRAGEEERAGETDSITRHSTTGAQSQAETEVNVQKPWYLAISYPLLLCVLYLSSLIKHSRITVQVVDLLHGHVGAYCVWLVSSISIHIR